jgi:hypothetical protein
LDSIEPNIKRYLIVCYVLVEFCVFLMENLAETQH